MITGELKSKVDRIWDTMWSGGISNPLSVIEQLTYLLFIKRLDELQTLEERKASRSGKPIESPIFTEKQKNLRWSSFKDTAADQMFATVRDDVFPFIKTLGTSGDTEDSTYSQHMKDAMFMMPSPRVLENVVDQLDSIDMSASDTKGDLYEYMLGKIASAGQNGQFCPNNPKQLSSNSSNSMRWMLKGKHSSSSWPKLRPIAYKSQILTTIPKPIPVIF